MQLTGRYSRITHCFLSGSKGSLRVRPLSAKHQIGRGMGQVSYDILPLVVFCSYPIPLSVTHETRFLNSTQNPRGSLKLTSVVCLFV